MPCEAQATTPTAKQEQKRALERLAVALGMGEVSVVIGAQGSISFRNWTDKGGVADLCAYRRLLASNSPELRRAVMRAETMSGRKVNAQAISAGVHSHDGGATWGSH